MDLEGVKWRLTEKWRQVSSRINTHPIFILGNQKSGTSAIANLLAIATGKTLQNDIFCWQGDLYRSLINENISFKRYLQKSKYYYSKEIVKEPSLTFYFKELDDYFNTEKTIFVVRNPFDNIKSILSRLDLSGQSHPFEKGELNRVRKIGEDWYQILTGANYGHAAEDPIESLALRYNKSVEIYEEHKSKFLLVKYEEFNAEKENEIERIASWLGIENLKPIKAFIDKQYQPKGTDLSPEVFFSKESRLKIDRITSEHRRLVGYE